MKADSIKMAVDKLYKRYKRIGNYYMKMILWTIMRKNEVTEG